MPERACLFAILLVLAAPAAARATSLFDFDWTSSAEFTTLIPVNRVEPDGSITPYDQVRLSGTRSGSGILALTPPSAAFDGYGFEFSGVGGGGSGDTLPGGEILDGHISFPLPPDVPGGDGGGSFNGGLLTLEGDPSRPSGLSISYLAGSSPHCLFNCSRVEFHGVGRARGTVAAVEPEGVVVVVLGLLAAAWVRSRRAAAGRVEHR